jgi:hypothetical protein
VSTWTSDELDQIGSTDELELTAADRTVTIWVVRLGESIYVRSVYGRTSKWFRRVQERHEGHVSAGGVEKDVSFAEIEDDALIDDIGEAYRTKYKREPAASVDPMLGPEARAATLRLEPRP